MPKFTPRRLPRRPKRKQPFGTRIVKRGRKYRDWGRPGGIRPVLILRCAWRYNTDAIALSQMPPATRRKFTRIQEENGWGMKAIDKVFYGEELLKYYDLDAEKDVFYEWVRVTVEPLILLGMKYLCLKAIEDTTDEMRRDAREGAWSYSRVVPRREGTLRNAVVDGTGTWIQSITIGKYTFPGRGIPKFVNPSTCMVTYLHTTTGECHYAAIARRWDYRIKVWHDPGVGKSGYGREYWYDAKKGDPSARHNFVGELQKEYRSEFRQKLRFNIQKVHYALKTPRPSGMKIEAFDRSYKRYFSVDLGSNFDVFNWLVKIEGMGRL